MTVSAPFMPSIQLSASFTADPFGMPTWTDISTRFRSAQTARGRQIAGGLAGVLNGFDMGTMTLNLSNVDGALDPTYASSPYYPNVLPGTPIKLAATWNGVSYPLFFGYAWTFSPQYVQSADEVMQVTVNDAFSMLQNLQYVMNAGVPGEYTGSRISRILSAVMPSVSQAQIAAGNSHMVAILAQTGSSTPGGYASQAPNTATALDLCQQAEQTEYGSFYFDVDGTPIFEDRYFRASQAVVAAFSDAGTFMPSGVGTFPGIAYQNLVPSMDMTYLYNDVQVTDGLGRFYEYTDAASVTKYGQQSLQVQSQADAPNEGLSMAQWIVMTQKDAAMRFTSLQMMPQQDLTQLDYLYSQALGREISDLVVVERNPPSGNTMVQYCFIDRVEHDITPTTWTTTFGLSAQSQFSFTPWQLDNSNFRLGTNTTLGW